MVSLVSAFDSKGQLNELPWPQRKAVAQILAACLLIALVQHLPSLSLLWDLLDSSPGITGGDFVNYWSGAVLSQSGRLMDIFDPVLFNELQKDLLKSSFEAHNWSYPPHTLLFVSPLALAPYLWAYLFWVLAGLAAYLFATEGTNWRSLTAVALVVAPASTENILNGQVGFFAAALFIGGMKLVDRRPYLAGFLFGCLTFKPHLGVLIPLALLAAGLWRPIVSAAATTAILIGVTVLFFGLESWLAYFELVVPLQTRILEEGFGFYVLMSPSAFMSARSLGLDATIGYFVQAPFSLFAAGLVFWAYRFHSDRDLQLQIIIVATFLFSPYIFNYDMTMVSFAVILAYGQIIRSSFRPYEVVLLFLVWFLPHYVTVLSYSMLPIAPLILLSFAVYIARKLSTSLIDTRSSTLSLSPSG